jgi:gliding motility-associated-like protein
MKKGFLLIVFFCCSMLSYASHLIGGEMTYNCLGDNLYEITLTIYIDCGPSNTQGTSFDEFGTISIYNSSNNLVQELAIENPEAFELSDETVGNDCLELPTDLCVLRGVYTTVVALPAIQGGYQLAYQRCCRNPSVININNPENFGNTYTTNIPGSELVSDCNSSPSFDAYPPLALCLGDDINVNLSATDQDNDSLVYSLTTPFNGANTINPTEITPPPFTNIPWGPGYSENYPIDANPAIEINTSSGIITGSPTQMGMYIVGIQVDEYRDGLLINSILRDFRFLVVDCNVTTSSIPLTSWYCNSLTVAFENGSFNASNYLWDFGDNNATSNEFEPNHTYPDTGLYTVRLIANPSTVCADTNTVTFPLYTELTPSFTAPSPQCISNNSFTFQGEGLLPEGSNFNWEFGTGSSPATSNQLNPSNIVFPEVGTYPVSFNVQFEDCDETFTSSIEIYNEDLFPEIPNQTPQCFEGNLFTFAAAGTFPAESNFFWDFGSNASPQFSNLQNPDPVTFSTIGEQVVTLNVLFNGCENAVQQIVETTNQINPQIQSSPQNGCEPFTVEFSSLLDLNDFDFVWDLDNGNSSNETNPQATYTEGTYDVSLSVVDLNSLCEGSIILENYINVLPQPISSFSIDSDSLFYGMPVQISNNALNATSFLYQFNEGETIEEEEPSYIFPSIGEYTIWQFAQNEYECADTSSLRVTILGNSHTFWVPNAFTPNSNAINDSFYPTYSNVERYRMQIFDRWGIVVFDEEGTQPKWNGKDQTKNAEDQKSDHYTYLIQYETVDAKVHQVRGTVTLIR